MFLGTNARVGVRTPLGRQAAFVAALSSYKNLKSKATLKKLQARRAAEREAEADAGGEDMTIAGDAPWAFRTLNEETLGGTRDHQLSTAHRLEFQRLYVPDFKLPSQDDVVGLGPLPRMTVYGGDTKIPDSTKYTEAARKILKSETEWARDSMRRQLDGTFNPQFRQDLTAELRTAVPVPDLDWNVQFPMWNPRKFKPPRPTKGREQYMYALAKGHKYVFSKMQKGVYTRNGVSYRGLA